MLYYHYIILALKYIIILCILSLIYIVLTLFRIGLFEDAH